MKKVLSILSLIAILGLSTPAFAAPGGPNGHHPGPGMHGGPGGHRVHAGPSHGGHHMRPHGGVTVHAGHHPRHRSWHGHRFGYWSYPYCDYRLGCCNPFYPPGVGVHIPMGGASFSLRF